MRILMVSFVQNSRSTGMGKWSYKISGCLQELGHETTLWFEEDFPFARRLGRLAILVFPFLLVIRIFHHRRLFDAAIVHEPSAWWCALVRKFFRSMPAILAMSHGVESHGQRIMRQAARAGLTDLTLASRIKYRLIRRWQSDGALQRADHVFCLSTQDREYLVHDLGVPRERITFFCNGVSPGNFAPLEGRLRGKRVLFAGTWLDRKGRRLIPTVWRLVAAKYPDAHLTVLGCGAPEEAVRAEFDAALHSSITVIPQVNEEAEMTRYFGAHDVFFLPTLFEGSPLVVLEAMAAGLPVAASRAGGIPDLVQDGQEGLLFDAADAQAAAQSLCRLLEDSDFARSCSMAGQARARQLTWDAAAVSVAKGIEEALGCHR